jgi:hypothetical protein
MSAIAQPLPELLARIRREYLGLPGLKLTIPQAQRLWSLDRALCERALTLLQEHRFLRRTVGGTFVRADDRAA